MLDPQASRFWQAAVSSGLMGVEGLTACWNMISPAKRNDPEHIDRRLARQAVQSNALTLWQAQQLLAGRTSGYKVDRYLLLDMIGQGGMGRVYMARDTRLNRRVALKILAPERINNPRAVARFQREARVGAQLQHENLVRIYDFGEANGRYFLVMEFIDGKTIGQLISEQGPMPPPTASRLVRQVALGLGHAHSKGLIHRDVNPYNIMVTNEGIAKLADLGLAIDLTDGDRVTREGATVGTFDYVAPEQARHSHAADIRSDIYSLGCTLYHMLTGQVPFPSPSLPEKLFAHQALEPTPLEQLVPGLPEGLAEIVRKMMRKSADERYATPTKVVQALEPYLDEPAGYGPRLELSRPSLSPVIEASPRPDPPRGPGSAVTTPASSSPQPDEAGMVAVPAATTEPATVTMRPAAIPVGVARLPDGTPKPSSDPTSGADRDDPTVPLLTPIDDLEEQNNPGAFQVDLGPAPPLSERLARSKPRSAIVPRGSPRAGPHSYSWRVGIELFDDHFGGIGLVALPGVVWGLVVVAVVAIVLIVILGLAGGLHLFQVPSQESDAKTAPNRTVPEESLIVVRYDSPGTHGDGQGTPAKDLYEAIEASIGLGYVELRNRKPLHLEAGKLDNLIGSRGRLDIRAAPGVRPVLEIRMGGGKPFLPSGSSVALFLTGLELRVRYPKDPGGSSDVPPVIQAAESVHLERCAFQVVDGPGPDGCRAVTVEGNDLIVDRCWFQGFDKALQIHAFNGTFKIQQTMIVSGSPVADWHGWGVEVQTLPGGKGRRQLVLEDCTFEGAGLLDLVPGTVPLPLDVVVKRCAVGARAILAYPYDLHTAQFHWQGEGNYLEILENSWTVLSTHLDTPALSTSVIDRESWSKVESEKDPIRTKIIYRPPPTSRPSRPQDFAIEAPDSPDTKVGADPEKVGPWGQ